LDKICADCLTAEAKLYGAAFDSLASGQTWLQPDHAQLRDFVVKNSAVTPDDLDTELLKICSASDAFGLDKDGFVALLRENPISDGDALSQFMGLSRDGVNITAEDCRIALLATMQARTGTSLKEERCERIIDTVMVDAVLEVTFEQWFGYCKLAARIARVAEFANSSFFVI
jgi:hypothetical protein